MSCGILTKEKSFGVDPDMPTAGCAAEDDPEGKAQPRQAAGVLCPNVVAQKCSFIGSRDRIGLGDIVALQAIQNADFEKSAQTVRPQRCYSIRRESGETREVPFISEEDASNFRDIIAGPRIRKEFRRAMHGKISEEDVGKIVHMKSTYELSQLTHEPKEAIEALLTLIKFEESKLVDDPSITLIKFIAGKECPHPQCGFRETHPHGHQCHHVARGCTQCAREYCYRCLGTTRDCACGGWSNWCSPLRTKDDIEKYIVNEPYPHDTRCGCIICAYCRPGKPCFAGCTCCVCQGYVNPAPASADPELIRAWTPLTKKSVKVLVLTARIVPIFLASFSSFVGICERLSASTKGRVALSAVVKAWVALAGHVAGQAIGQLEAVEELEGSGGGMRDPDGGGKRGRYESVRLPPEDDESCMSPGQDEGPPLEDLFDGARPGAYDDDPFPLVRDPPPLPDGCEYTRYTAESYSRRLLWERPLLRPLMRAAARAFQEGGSDAARRRERNMDVDINAAFDDQWDRPGEPVLACMFRALLCHGRADVLAIFLSIVPMSVSLQLAHRDVDGDTALHVLFADENASYEVCRFLLLLPEEDIDLNIRDGRGNTPLMVASRFGRRAALSLLLEDQRVLDGLGLENEDGLNAAALALLYGHTVNGSLAFPEIVAIDMKFFPIVLRSREVSENIVRFILSTLPDGCIKTILNDQDSQGATPLLAACRRSASGVLEAICSSMHVDAELTDNDGVSPLQEACNIGYLAIVQILIERGGAKVNYYVEHRPSPLHIATRSEKVPLMQYLRSKGADTEELWFDSALGQPLTPLMWAVCYGKIEAAELLVHSLGADLNVRFRCQSTPVLMAHFNGHVELSVLLAQCGSCDLSHALVMACERKRVAFVKLMLERVKSRGDLVEATSAGRSKYTLLMIACKHGFWELADILLAAGACLTSRLEPKSVGQEKEEDGMGPFLLCLHGCAQAMLKNRNTDGFERLQLLLVDEMLSTLGEAAGRELNLRDITGRTSLHMAVELGHIKLVNSLVRTGFLDVDARDVDERSPLHYSYLHYGASGADMVEVLLAAGCCRDIKDSDGNLPHELRAPDGCLEGNDADEDEYTYEDDDE